MAVSVSNTIDRLFATKDGEAAFRCVDNLVRAWERGSDEAKAGLARYLESGPLKHVREHIASELAESAEEGDAELAAAFRSGLKDDATRFWSIEGYLAAAGRKAYEEVAAIALNKSFDVEQRAQAIKCLAAHSGQPFDRGLEEDPGEWTVHELRTDEVRAWAEAGFPAGEGYEEPERHPALDKPKTRFEKTVAALDERLAELREESQDPANPSNWLTPADPEDLKAIEARWNLPKLYLDFLTRFSPLNVSIPMDDEDFAGEIRLLGASELIEGQRGYAVGKSGKPLKGWPREYIVIAEAGLDPYVLDLSESDGKDAPVLTAMHGTGEWEFECVTDSFEKFLARLSE